ncbi:hypothetical protein WJX73_008712 [Symbiochloris irregularis]|uniref:Amidophosphoribosyltransferase n=1 Tax=Symbiochloris irregularis TaxID=706552 RepID=A0AAW1NKS5_9CHLO
MLRGKLIVKGSSHSLVRPAPSAFQRRAATPCRQSRRHTEPNLCGSWAGRPLTAVQLQSSRSSRRQGRQRLLTQDCGILGIFKHQGDASAEIYEGLLMLQHRGQDSAGMVTTDGERFREHKDNGLVREVFQKQRTLSNLAGSSGIGHVRYPTAGSLTAQEAQPFFVNSPLGIYLIHNGNLTNPEPLRARLSSSQSYFSRHLRTESDSEVLLNIWADEIHRAHQRYQSSGGTDPGAKKADFVLEAGEAMMKLLEGAYSCISLVKDVGLVAFRDPHGIRPLVLGKRHSRHGDEWCVASEDCAFGPIGFERVRDVQPGEMIIIDKNGQLTSRQCARGGWVCPCIFEYIYLARPDSVLNNISVYNFQLGLGTRLARRILDTQWKIDCVVPVPDGSRPAAIQISAVLGLPYREGLVKNRYVGRTFIMPDQRIRELSVRRKLNAMPTVFAGKNVLLVDDSIVRGTTMRQIVGMVRKAGAKKVYLASASPPVRWPNVYGVDMPTRKEFVACDLDENQICQVLGADGLLYQTLEDLLSVGQELNPAVRNFEASCFTGKYITAGVDSDYLAGLENSVRQVARSQTSKSEALAPGTAGTI